MLEIRPTIKWDKGKALEFLLESLGEFRTSNFKLLYYKSYVCSTKSLESPLFGCWNICNPNFDNRKKCPKGSTPLDYFCSLIIIMVGQNNIVLSLTHYIKYSFLGFGNCTDVFPVYIGDDRTDEDAFKVSYVVKLILYSFFFPFIYRKYLFFPSFH